MQKKSWFWPVLTAANAMLGTAALYALGVPRSHPDDPHVPLALSMAFAGLAVIEAWWLFQSPFWFSTRGGSKPISACLALIMVFAMLCFGRWFTLGSMALFGLPLLLLLDTVLGRIVTRVAPRVLRRRILPPS